MSIQSDGAVHDILLREFPVKEELKSTNAFRPPQHLLGNCTAHTKQRLEGKELGNFFAEVN